MTHKKFAFDSIKIICYIIIDNSYGKGSFLTMFLV